MSLSKIIFPVFAACLLSACGGDQPNPEPDGGSSSSSSHSSNSSSSSSGGPISALAVLNPGNLGPAGALDRHEISLPVQMRITEDGRRLERGGFFKSDFFDDTVVETIYIDFPNNNWQQQLEQNQPSSTDIGATVRYKDQVFEDVGIRYRGMTSYMMSGEKKSFSVDLEWRHDDQDIGGYNEFKLNNAFGDPSAMRQVLYSHLGSMNHPMAQAAFVQVVVNGRNFGLYWKVQKNDRRHAREWLLDRDATRWRAEPPGGGAFGGGFGGGGFGGGGFGGGGFGGGGFGGGGFGGGGFGGGGFGGGGFGGGGDFGSIFGAGTSSLNDHGPNGSAYENYYTIKGTPRVDNPWQDLANAAHTLGNAHPEYLIDEVGQFLDIDAALWFLATENMFVDEDGYINKGGMDYYVYFDVATGRIMPIEYDGNEILYSNQVSSWGPFHKADNADYPLLNVLLNHPELRQRYLAHYRTLMEYGLNENYVLAKIDEYFDLIEPFVADNTAVREYSYQEFLSGVQQLRSYFQSRRNFLNSNGDLNTTGLTISDVIDSVDGADFARPRQDQSVRVSARVSGNSGVRAVYLYYGTGLAGTFNKVAMSDQGGGIYAADIPPQIAGDYVRYYIEAIANNSAGTASYNPARAEHDVYIYQVRVAEDIAHPVVINEFMSSNRTVAADEDGDYDDWVELYNNSNQPYDLSGYHMSDKEHEITRWTFPSGTVIPANGYLIVWLDNKDKVDTGLHTNFSLARGGEALYLVTPDLQFADRVVYGEMDHDTSYARIPNGTGDFEVRINPSFNAANN